MLVSQKNLWIGTDENGLLKMPDNEQRIVLPDIGAPITGKLNNLLQDNEGNIWMNTANELVLTAGDKLSLLHAYDKTLFATVHSLLCDHRNNIWASTEGGLIRYDLSKNPVAVKKFQLQGLNSKTDITSLYQDPYHNIWVGTMGSGIFVLDPETGRFRNLDENPLLKNASILSVSGRGNTVCAGGLEGVAMIFELNGSNANISAKYNFTNYNNIVNIGNNYIYYVFKDSRGRIWFGTDGKGITVLEKGNFTHYGKETGLKDDHIYSFTEDANGKIWFNTEKSGIYSFDGKHFRNYSSGNGISNLKITTVKSDKTGQILIIHEKGIDILDPQTGTVSYLNNSEGISDVITDIGGITQDTAGNILMATASGIVRYVPVSNTVRLPKTVIDNIQLFFNDLDKNIPGDFNYDENSFTFNFTGIYYTNPFEVHYQYRLEGLDTNWISTRDRNVAFLRLQPGKYNFHVRSSLNENFEGVNEASYEFIIASPIWKRA
jgi:ligand-binding sensor domain-containing protein